MLFGNNTTNAAMAALANGGVDPNQQQVDPNQPMPTQNIDFIREMTKPARPRLNKFANFMMGFGAGYQGKGQEFLANQMTLSKERKSAAAKDLQTARDMLAFDINEAKEQGLKVGSNEYKAFVSKRASDFLVNQRRPQIRRLGGASDETDALTHLLISDPDAAFSNMSEDLTIARRSGLLPQMKYGIEDSYVYSTDPVTGKITVINDLDKTRNMTSQQKNLRARTKLVEDFGADSDEVTQFDRLVKSAGVNIDLGQNAKFETEINTKLYMPLVEEQQGASEEMFYLNQLKDMDLKTGSLSGFRSNLRNLATTIFPDDSEIGDLLTNLSQSDAEDLAKYDAISKRMLNKVLNIATGPQTEGDAQRAKDTIPAIDNPTMVNEFLIDVMMGVADAKRRRIDFVDAEIARQNERGEATSVRKALGAWRNYSENVVPMVSTFETQIGTRADGSAIMGRDLYHLYVARAKAAAPGATMEQINKKWTQANFSRAN
jgi:hypothetical protein